MPLLVSLADIRDGFIIVYGTVGILFFLAATLVIVLIGRTVLKLIKNVNALLDDSVKPTVTSIREAAETVKGTTEFVGKTTITPIVKTYSMFAGVKKAMNIAASVTGRKKR